MLGTADLRCGATNILQNKPGTRHVRQLGEEERLEPRSAERTQLTPLSLSQICHDPHMGMKRKNSGKIAQASPRSNISPGIDPELARVHFLPTSMTNEFFERVGDNLGSNCGRILGLDIIDEGMQPRFLPWAEVLEYRLRPYEILCRQVGIIVICQKERRGRATGNEDDRGGAD